MACDPGRIKLGDLQMAAAYDTLDGAVGHLQTVMNQDDGGIAGMFFSGEEKWGDRWPTLPFSTRRRVLMSYALYEMDFDIGRER